MQNITKGCLSCVYGYTCGFTDEGKTYDEAGERVWPRDNCVDEDYKHWKYGDPILRKRELEFSGKVNIVLNGEHEVNRLWDWKKTFEHLIETCENVGFMTYRHPEDKNALRCETSFGPAFDLFFSEDRKTLLRITKSTRHQKDLNFIDFNWQDTGKEMDYR
jgi:hypothetical protein